MVGQTRGPSRPNMAPPRSFYPTSPPSSEQRRGSTGAPPDPDTSDMSSESNIADDEMKTVSGSEPGVQKSQTSLNTTHLNQKSLDSIQTNVKMLNSEVPQFVKKMPQITNSQILSILPSGKSVENAKQIDKTEGHIGGGGGAKRSENQPNFLTMQQKINEKLLANQIPIQRLPEQQFILKQVGSSDNIVTMTTAKITEPNQNYFAMLTNKAQPNYVNYLSLPVNQQNFITVEQQQKNNIVVMEAQPKTNFVTVPQKSNVQSSGQTYLVHGNGADLKQFNSYLAVTSKPGDTNGTTFFTMTPTKHASGPQTAYLMTPKQSESSRTFVAVAQKPSEATYLALPAGKTNENNKTATFIAMEPNKSDTNIIVTQVLPSSQQSPQLFQLEYAENEGGKTGKYYNSRDSSVMQSVVPKLSCTISSGSVMSTKTVMTNTVPPLTSVSSITTGKRSITTSKVITPNAVSPGKSSVPPLATSGSISFVSSSGNITFLSSSNVQSSANSANSSIATSATISSNDSRWNSETEVKQELNSASSQEPNSSPTSSLTVPMNTVLTSNVPHSHQYLIPNVDNLKLAAESINKMIPTQPNSGTSMKSPAILKAHQADQNFQMHNYSKNESAFPNHASKTNLHESSRRKYGQLENNKIPSKNIIKYSHNMYSNHQRSDKNQNFGSYKSRVVETRPTNHQRINDIKNLEITKPGKGPVSTEYIKKEMKEEAGDIDVEDTKVKKQEDDDDEEEGVEVRPVFDLRIPLVFQVVLTDHCYGMPMLLLRDEKPVPTEDDKESVISSDGKGEDGEETETAAEGEDSITRCICDLEHDDGYMVCCDKCSVWQHVACVFPDVRVGTPLPEEYLCDACHPRKLDRNRARALQLQRRKQIFNNSDSSDSSSSSLEIAPRAKDPPPKKTVARRRAEPIPRKPMKMGKTDHGHNDTVVKNSMTKARRKESNLKAPPSSGRRTKLKRKLDSRMPRTVVRRKSKIKEIKSEKDSNSNSSSNNNNNNNYHQKERSESTDRSEECQRKSPDIRTRLQMLKNTSTKELNAKASTRVRCRMSNLPQGDPILIASCNVARGQLLVEIRGKFLLSDETPGKSDCLFFYRFPKDGSEIVVDGAGHENLARYARKSCRPNTEMKHCIVKGSLRLYLVAKEDLNKNQEITLAHNSVSDTSQKEGCLCRNKDCPFFLPKNSQNTATERRRRGRRRTVSEESEGSPVKHKKEKSSAEPVRRNSSITQSSRSPSSPNQAEHRGEKEKDRKLTRDERKIEQAMKIFAQMERDTARKKDKDRPQMPVSSNRKDSHVSSKADSDKESLVESNRSRRRRRRRRRKSRKSRLSSTASSTNLNQYNSGDSDISSGDELPSPRKGSSKDSRDEDMQSPVEKMSSPRERGRRDSCNSREKEKRNDAAGLLLALGGRFLPGQKTPTREKESENEGSPPTPLSSACLLVAAAVGPLAPGFRFPKTKKGLMNEWLSKSPEHSSQDNFSPTQEIVPPNVQSESSLPPGAPKLSNLSNRLFNFPIDSKSLDLKETVKDSRMVLDGKVPSGTPAGFGKKRWLRQAISEECDAPQGQNSPPCPPDNVTPLKKRRLARESLSSDPPTTPPMPPTTAQTKEDRAYSGDINSPESPTMIDTESEISLAERVDALKREYLEAQERNLLKTYGRYENECTRREQKDNEEFERFNNFNSSPQRVPENLSFKLQEAEYYQESNQNLEKPLDLTNEKEKVSDAEVENENLETSPRHTRRGRGRKILSKKAENETRAVARTRRNKIRKGENDLKGGQKDEKELVVCEQNGGDSKMRSESEERKLEFFESGEKNELWPKIKSECKESKSKLDETKDLVITLENSSRVPKPDSKEDSEEFSFISTDKSERTSDDTSIGDKVDFVSKDIKEEVENKIVQNGFEGIKIEDKSHGVEEKNFSLRTDESMVSGKLIKSETVPENSRELFGDSKQAKIEDADQFLGTRADKSAPIKRKLSITEYLKRKKTVGGVSGNKTTPTTPVVEEETNMTTNLQERTSPVTSSPSDEDRSRFSLPTPSLPPVFFDVDKNLEKPGSGVRFKPEPTELERQRENLTERLRREFGLLISDDDPKPIKMDTEDLMPPPPPPNCPYPPYPVDSPDNLDPIGKRSLYHPPTQPLPQSAIYPVGSSNPPNPCVFNSPYSLAPPIPPPPPHDEKRKERKNKKFKQ